MQIPTESELPILRLLWQSGPLTVREVNDRLNEQSDKAIGYTTTLKLMQLMAEKGLVTRDTTNRSHVYAAAVPQERTQGTLIDRFVSTAFGGSHSELVLRALGNGEATPEELAKIKQLIAKIEKEEGNG